MDFLNKRVLVCGLGLSGIASAKLLRRLGAEVTAQDIKPAEKIQNIEQLSSEAFEDCGFPDAPDIKLYLEKNPDDIVGSQDLIVLSPGIPADLPFVERARELNVPVWGEIELAYGFCPGPIIAITGTNGKTTTTSLCGEILKSYKQGSRVVGNIGVSFADTVGKLAKDDFAVVEMSSFQLETIHTFRPAVAAILNVTPDHLDRHKTLQNYTEIKKRIFENQQSTDFAVLNYDDAICRDMADGILSQAVFFSKRERLSEGVFLDGNVIRMKFLGVDEEIIHTSELKIPGGHNIENTLAAVAICFCAGVPTGVIKEGLKNFEGVEHRIEFVRELCGVRFYNDSKATNPDSAIKAVEAMSRPIVLIGGGYDKNSDFSDWIKIFDGRVKHFIVLGEVANKIIDTCKAHNFESFERVNSLRDAVELGFSRAEDGDCVLLSPACASYDMFDNYEQRGKLFKEFVNGLR